MSKKAFLDEFYLLWILINQTREAVFKAREKHVGSYRYQKQGAALIIIWSYEGKATPTLLSRYLFLERHTASELITRMEENGLVTKKRDEKHKSMVRITITPKGQKVCNRNMGADVITEIMSTLSVKEREQLMVCMRVLLNKACDKLGAEVILPSIT